VTVVTLIMHFPVTGAGHFSVAVRACCAPGIGRARRRASPLGRSPRRRVHCFQPYVFRLLRAGGGSVYAPPGTAVPLLLCCVAASRGFGRRRRLGCRRLPLLSRPVATLRPRAFGGTRLWRHAVVPLPGGCRGGGGAEARVRRRSS